MDAPGDRVDEPREGVHVRRLELRQLAVLDEQAGHFVSHGGELLQHLVVGRRTRLRLLEDRELVLFEQHVPQLRRGVDVEVGARRLIDGPLEGGELDGKRPGNLAQPIEVDAHAVPLHVDEHSDERQLDGLEQAQQLVILELGL